VLGLTRVCSAWSTRLRVSDASPLLLFLRIICIKVETAYVADEAWLAAKAKSSAPAARKLQKAALGSRVASMLIAEQQTCT